MNTSRTFRAAPSSYAILCGLCGIPAILWLVYFIKSGKFEIDFFLAVIAIPLSFAIWLSAFRLRIDATGISYRSLFKGERRLAYSQITAVRKRVVAPVSRRPLGLGLELVGGHIVLLNLKPFPWAATEAILAIPALGSNTSLERTRER